MRVALCALLVALADVASALSFGPYQVGDGTYFTSEFPKGIAQVFSQGAALNVANATRKCSVSGAGIDIASTTFRFGPAFYSPNRANASYHSVGYAHSIAFGVPSAVVKYFTSAGATALTVNQSSVITNLRIVTDGQSSTVNSQLGSLSFSTTNPVPNSNAPFTIVKTPTRSLISVSLPVSAGSSVAYTIGFVTFNLAGAGKNVNVTCQAPSGREPILGWTFVRDLPVVPGGSSLSIAAPATGKPAPGLPPSNVSSFVSAYKPNCTFGTLGKTLLQISLAGAKSGALVSTSNPILFKQGQSNFNFTNEVASFLRSGYPTAAKASLKLSTFNVNITNASPAVKNLLPSIGSTSTNFTLPTFDNSFATPSLPSAAPSSTFADASFTPVNVGQSATAVLSFGTIKGTLTLYNAQSALVAAIPLTCDEGIYNPVVTTFDIA
ncbi:hypothetical protein OC834_007334 [Tilletia horrida]|nr:hypothetical protein OC834_007334 [Tilletia horrida]